MSDDNRNDDGDPLTLDLGPVKAAGSDTEDRSADLDTVGTGSDDASSDEGQGPDHESGSESADINSGSDCCTARDFDFNAGSNSGSGTDSHSNSGSDSNTGSTSGTSTLRYQPGLWFGSGFWCGPGFRCGWGFSVVRW